MVPSLFNPVPAMVRAETKQRLAGVQVFLDARIDPGRSWKQFSMGFIVVSMGFNHQKLWTLKSKDAPKW
jgi:hypothetical protein